MKALIMCSIARDTGAYVRGKYLVKGLKEYGFNIKYLKTFKSKPFGLYYLLSIPDYFFKTLFTKADVVIALKPYPNTLFPAIIKKLSQKSA